jgi:putative transposase
MQAQAWATGGDLYAGGLSLGRHGYYAGEDARATGHPLVAPLHWYAIERDHEASRAGRYFISFVVEEEVAPKPPAARNIGIDLGLKALVATSDGTIIPAPRFFRRAEKRIAHAHRVHSRKQPGSRNREKARRKLARAHARVSDCRTDFLHKLTTTLINENQMICVEDLAVEEMVRNHWLSKSIADAAWGELVRQIKYKAAWYGRTVYQADRFFPSTLKCSGCGFELVELDLSVRRWTCPKCRVTHDRDFNAAKNLLAAGLAASACGGPVRP